MVNLKRGVHSRGVTHRYHDPAVLMGDSSGNSEHEKKHDVFKKKARIFAQKNKNKNNQAREKHFCV